MQALETWSGYNKVTLMWTRGHHGIPRNEEGDKLAKEGTNTYIYIVCVCITVGLFLEFSLFPWYLI